MTNNASKKNLKETMMDKFPEYKSVEVDTLIPYARNSRTHTDDQVDKVAASIKEFGFLNPVITDGEQGIVAGHCRVLAAKKLSMGKIPTVEAKHLSEAQKRAYVIADNRLALDAGWDDELLKVEIEELDAEGFDLSLLGWGDDLPEFATEPDYSILDEMDDDGELEELASGVRKAIQIEFEQEHYEEAQELVKFWREQGGYIGMMLIEKLKAEKDKL